MARTYSDVVDEALKRSLRPDRQADIESFVNQTIRDLHLHPKGGACFFAQNLVEERISATSDTGFLWPVPADFQRMLTVRYPGVGEQEFPDGVYPKFLSPGRVQNREDYFYYRTGTHFAFKGYGGLNALIDLAYYRYASRLSYYAPAARPAIYDDKLKMWTYAPEYNTSELEQQAKELVTNWIIFNWYDLVLEGTLAKLFKLIKDNDRAGTHYALFQSQREQFFASEAFETLGH